MNVFSTIGNTPTVTLERISRDCKSTIFAKLEFFNPTGSLKDRIYHGMITDAEKRQLLCTPMTILECSTGNAGISCAFVAAVKGYPCVIVMPEGMSEERKKMVGSYGADIIFTPGGESDVDLALEKVDELCRTDPDRYWVPSQFTNTINVDIHYKTTARELWDQTGGVIDACVLAPGTGGSLTGIGRYLKEKNHHIELYAVEPNECAVLSRNEWGPHAIEGIGDGFVPQILDLSLLTGVITVSSDEAIAMTQRLAREEGIFCGLSSGANIAAILKLAKTKPTLKSFATIINDGGERYFTTPLFSHRKGHAAFQRPRPRNKGTTKDLIRHQQRWTVIS